jgi:transposase-like protein
MALNRKRRSAEFKVKVALEAAKEIKTLNEIASEYAVHSTQVAQWKRQLLEGLNDSFAHGNSKIKTKKKGTPDSVLYQEIGQLTMELNWLKKKFCINN